MRENPTSPLPPASESGLSVPAWIFLALTVVAGLGTFVFAGLTWPSGDWSRFVFYAAVVALASSWKVRLPGAEITLSVNFFSNLLVAVELGFCQAVAVAGLSGIIQSYWRTDHKPEPGQVPFNISVMALSSAAAALVFDSHWVRGLSLEVVPRIALAATAQYCVNSLLVSLIVVLTSPARLLSTLKGLTWLFAYYFIAAIVVGMFHGLSLLIGWQSALLSLPTVYFVYRSFRFYMDRLDAQRRHASQISDLQRRTIEALALAIECKDETTHQHLSRVQVYALEMGRELGLTEDEMEALRAASLLHDIGKLAVPEQIINKPGRLTPEEFNKMKIHPGVGAEILSSVQFPYPVVPFVRSHHEKWDGTGYPDGLKGEEIPIGARIIAVVDCLDALASDRQYRPALPLDKAMEIVGNEAGKAFEPRIVEILSRRYIEFEDMAKRQSALLPKLSLNLQVERGDAPGAGFASVTSSLAALASAVEAREQALRNALELIRCTGAQLAFAEIAALADVRLRTLIPNDGLAAYRIEEGKLLPAYVSGEDAKTFGALRIAVGQGLSGWVALNRKSIVNGNPAVERIGSGNPSRLDDPPKATSLKSALSVPIQSESGEVLGVLTLHSLAKDAFTDDDSRALEAIGSAIGQAVAGERARSVSRV